MIKSLTVINKDDESLKMELTNPWDSGMIVESITGIGPGKANINSTELATTDGSIYSSARLPERNIVISLRFIERPDIETTRQMTYHYFPIKEEVTLIFETDHRTVAITGHVESNEPDIFSNEEGCQISVLCHDPYFYANIEDYILNGVAPAFSFPFSNESLVDPIIEMGAIIYQTGGYLRYDGDVESGVLIHIHATGGASDIWIKNISNDTTMFLDTSKIKLIVGTSDEDLIEGDDLYISTMKSNRYVRLYRNGTWYNVLSTLPKTSEWIVLQRGDNVFSYGAGSGASNCQIDMQSYVLYQGI